LSGSGAVSNLGYFVLIGRSRAELNSRGRRVFRDAVGGTSGTVEYSGTPGIKLKIRISFVDRGVLH